MKNKSLIRWAGAMAVAYCAFLIIPAHAEMMGGEMIPVLSKFTALLNAGKADEAKKMTDALEVESINTIFGAITVHGLANPAEIAARGAYCGMDGQEKDAKKCFEYALMKKDFASEKGKSFLFKAELEKGGKCLLGVMFADGNGDIKKTLIESFVVTVSEKDNVEGFASISNPDVAASLQDSK